MFKLSYFGQIMVKPNSLEKALILGKVEVKRRKGWPSSRWMDSAKITMSALLGALKDQVRDILSWKKIYLCGY